MDVTLKEVPAVPVAAVRDVFNEYQDIYGMFDEVADYLAGQGMEVATTRVALFYDTVEGDNDIEATATIPLPDGVTELPDAERIMVDELPAEPLLACVAHVGPINRLDESYEAVQAWIAERGYTELGPRRLVVYEDGVLELQVPVKEA